MLNDLATLGTIITRNARDRGGETLLVHDDRRLTYAEYAERCHRLASAFARLGARSQDRIACLSMNCLAPYEIFGACELAGYIVAPVNFRLAVPEMLYVLGDSSPSILLFQRQYLDTVEILRAKLPRGMRYICIDGTVDWAESYEALIASGSPDGPGFRAGPDDLAHLFYTSGTTGRPKGAVHTHATVTRWLETTVIVSEFNPGTCVLQTSPSFHVGGKFYVNAVASVGGRAVIANGFDAARVADLIERERVTFTFMVGPMIEALLALPDVDRRDFSSLQKVISAAAPIPVPLLRRAIERIGPVFAIQYGSTETGNIGNMWRHEVRPDGSDVDRRRLASVGRPVPGIDLRLVDDDDRDVPRGEAGEVVIRSNSLQLRYWNNDIATAEAFRGGWFHTGDVGRMDEDGFLYLIDRKKDMIISGGENIYSREVETALQQHPDVADVAVIGVPDPRWGEAVCAIVRPAGEARDADQLIAHVRGLIAGYKAPKRVHFVDELPYLPSGKVNKVALRETYANLSNEQQSVTGE